MNKKDRDTLTTKRVELVENIIMEGLLTHLIAKKVLSGRYAESINVLQGNSKQVEHLLNLLPCRGPTAFDRFCEALIESDQEFIVSNYLKGNETNNLSIENIPNSKNKETNNELSFKDDDNHILKICYKSTSPLKKYDSAPAMISPRATDKRHLLKHVTSEPASLQSSLGDNQNRITGCDRIDNCTSQKAVEELDPKKRKLSNEEMPGGNHLLDLKIKSATQKFYFKNFSEAYKMDGIPRGLALVININKITGLPLRTGSDIDQRKISSLLHQLHFKVVSYDDDKLTAKNILIKVREFKDLPGHKNADATVVCLFSHGVNGYIYGTDGEKVSLNELFSLFDVDQCPNLRKRPKIFIMQSCRGDKVDLRKVPTIEIPPGDCTDGSLSTQNSEPRMSDALFCYPTQEGYRAWRNQMEGSWYIQALVDIFVEHAFEKDICAMLNMVNCMVSERTSLSPLTGMDGAKQMSEYKSTLRKPYLYFFPGISSKPNWKCGNKNNGNV